MEKKEKFDQLCWDCRKATGLCPWSAWQEPVEGWTATPTVIDDLGEKIRSYKITACPLFEREEKRKRICPGDRMNLKLLGELLKVQPRVLKAWPDWKIKNALEESGLRVDIQRKRVRIIKFLGFRKEK